MNLLSASDVRQLLAHVPERRADWDVVAKVAVCPSDDPNSLATMRRIVATYRNIEPYASYHDWLGRAELLRELRDAWRPGDRRRAVETFPDEVFDELVVHGDPEPCRDRLRADVDRHRGVTAPVVGLLLAGPNLLDSSRARSSSTVVAVAGRQRGWR